MADRKAELEKKRKRLEEIRKAREEKQKLGKSLAASATGSTGQAANASAIRTSTSADIDEILHGIDLSSTTTVIPSPQKSSTPQDTQPVSPEDSKTTSPVPLRKVPKLSVTHLNGTNIPPKEPVFYTKETQTIVIEHEPEDGPDKVVPEVQQPKPEDTTEKDESKRKREERNEEAIILELSDDQRQTILGSQDFSHFFDRATRLMERAISENRDLDICYDYAGGEETEGDFEAAAKLSLNRQFWDERWSKHRCVTCMDWSKQYPELLVASYNQNDDAPQDPDGIALIWNMKYHKESPDYIFHNQSAIMSVCFADFHPNLLVGGTYSGQIVLWDNRNRKRTPVQKTPLSATAHTHPVYCIKVIGTQNAHNLITISTDGRMCSWSLDMLSNPQDTMDLVQQKQTKNVSVMCMSFLSGDVNNFAVGCEDGCVYTGLRHGSKIGIVEQFDGHYGPVTGIDYNAVPGPIDFSHLFLSSSFDWTVKLWNSKTSKLLYSFEDNGDYTYDVQWSPIHPALFATADIMGRLDIWNLNKDTEVPTTSVTVESMAAINKIRWTSSGHQLAAGDDDGHIFIYDVGEQLAHPRPDEWSRFVNTLQELQANTLNLPPVDAAEYKPMSPTSYMSSPSSYISPPRI